MSLAESGIIPPQKEREAFEGIDWTPALTLKPHHAIFTERTRKSIIGEKVGTKKSFMFYLVGQRLNLYGYSRDVVGTTVRGIRDNFRQEADFLRKLNELPPEAIVQLDLGRDDICKACVAGKHCMASNFKVGLFPNYEKEGEGEQRNISKVHDALVANGYQEGEDFIFKQTQHVLYDYGGGNFKNVTDPEPLNVTFNSMLVKMGALRAVIQTVKA